MAMSVYVLETHVLALANNGRPKVRVRVNQWHLVDPSRVVYTHLVWSARDRPHRGGCVCCLYIGVVCCRNSFIVAKQPNLFEVLGRPFGYTGVAICEMQETVMVIVMCRGEMDPAGVSVNLLPIPNFEEKVYCVRVETFAGTTLTQMTGGPLHQQGSVPCSTSVEKDVHVTVTFKVIDGRAIGAVRACGGSLGRDGPRDIIVGAIVRNPHPNLPVSKILGVDR
mmetsp:Transcript_28738/g.62960  ORF Transcript_28738/g.62960 Transcript_28738/m.62960 type:complete len:223 (-) Transcript_28738:382-1050(-)